jgi:hypothetical protein
MGRFCASHLDSARSTPTVWSRLQVPGLWQQGTGTIPTSIMAPASLCHAPFSLGQRQNGQRPERGDARMPVAFGLGLILLLPLLADGLGRAATPGQACLPPSDRLRLLQPLLHPRDASCSRDVQRRLAVLAPSGSRLASLSGLAIGLMHATKETVVLIWLRWRAPRGRAVVCGGQTLPGPSCACGCTRRTSRPVSAWRPVSITLFTSFYTQLGPLDSPHIPARSPR